MTKNVSQTSKLSRRSFLKKSGWLAVGATVLFSTSCSLIPAIPTTSDNPEEDVTSWIQVTPDNRIRYFMGKAEMGQGIMSGLSQIIAAEFNMSLSDVDLIFPHTNQIPPVRMTVGSETISTLYPFLRQASAQLKESIQAALLKNVGGSQLDLVEKEGGVLHLPSQKFYTYGDIVAQSETIELLQSPPNLQPPHKQPLIGKKVSHLGTPEKIKGSAIYTHDVRLPNMLFGKVAKPPFFEATIEHVDSGLAKQAPGIVKVVQKLDENFVGVVAKTEAQAEHALKQLKIKWDTPKVWQQSDIDQTLDIEYLKSEGVGSDTIRDEGNVEDARDASIQHLKRNYSTPFGTHAAMETHAGVAHVTKEKAEVWVGSQDSFFHQKIASKITGLSEEKINVHPTFIGGSFGGKVMVGAAVEAIHLSHAIRKPVRVIWNREENFQHGYFRTPSQHQIEAGLTKDGRVNYWKHEHSSGAVIFSTAALPRTIHHLILTFTSDAGATRGAKIPYSFANQQLEQWDRIFPIPTGAWRGLSSSTNAFAIESTMDDLAHLAKIDPLAFRLNHLGKEHQRLKNVLTRVTSMVDWKETLPSGKGRGLACGIYKETAFVAVVAEVSILPDSQSIKVDRLFCAQDCGLIINPNSVEAMIEGNLVWGVGMALKEELHVKDGKMDIHNFDDFSLPRMKDFPPIEIALIEDKNVPPAGAGEPAIMPTPAAIANAVFNATGKRATQLPIKWDDLFI